MAGVLRELGLGPVAIESESGGGRISLWLTVEHPELVDRLVLAAVASETPPDSPMAERMRHWIELGEAGDWGTFFANMANRCSGDAPRICCNTVASIFSSRGFFDAGSAKPG